MLTCKQLTELVTDYLEGQLSFGQRLSFQWHLGMCKDCRAYLHQMKTTVRALGKIADEPLPVDVRNELLARFRKMRPRTVARASAGSIRLLATLEKLIGGRRGWVAAGLMLLVALVAALASGVHPGSLGEATTCFRLEVGAGLIPVTLMGLMAFAKQSRLSSGTFATLGTLGGLIAFAMLEAICPMRHVAQHVLAFHLGGLVFAGLVGVAASRLPAFR